jgi:hypothetical protein
MTRVTLGKSRVRESRMPGSVRAKPNGLATRPRPLLCVAGGPAKLQFMLRRKLNSRRARHREPSKRANV